MLVSKRLSKLTIFWLSLIISLVFYFGININTAAAAPNLQINYQGKLTDLSDSPVADDDYMMSFRLCTGSSGENCIWTEDRSSAKVHVANGLFSVMLGEVTPFDSSAIQYFGQALYLEVGVGSTTVETLSPRKILGTVPSAFEAQKLGGLSTSSFLRSDTTNTSALFDKSTSTNFFSNLLTAITGWFTDLFFSNATGTNLTVGNLNATSSATLVTTTINGRLTVGSLTGILSAANGIVGVTSSISSASLASNVMVEGEDISLLNNDVGYVTSGQAVVETDPVYSSSSWFTTTNNASNWDAAVLWGNHADAGYLLSFTETDPDFGASAASGITGTNISNWNTAYGWGDHAIAGYITSTQWTTTGTAIYYNSGKVGIGTAAPTAKLHIKGSGSIGTAVFSGTGLDDLTAGGSYSGSDSGTVTYTVVIDGTGDPDTFKWKKNNGDFTEGVSITTSSAQLLSDGITVLFSSTTGHTLSDQWTITVTLSSALVVQDAAGTDSLYVGNNGYVGIGTSTPSSNLQIVYNQDINSGGINVTNINNGTAATANITVSNDVALLGGLYGLSSGHGFSLSGLMPTNTLALINPTSSVGILTHDDILFSRFAGLSYNELMRLTSSGNLGIGTSTPGFKLVVNSNNSTDNLFLVATTTNPNILRVNANGTVSIGHSDDYYQFDVYGGSVRFANSSSDHRIYAANYDTSGLSGLVAFAATGTLTTANSIRVTRVGNDFSGVGSDGFLATSSGVVAAGENLVNGLTLAAIAPNAPIRFYAGGTTTAYERMIITSGGDVGIGTTAPQQRIDLVDSSGAGAIKVGSTTLAYAGTIRYDSGASDFQGYDGSGWRSLTNLATVSNERTGFPNRTDTSIAFATTTRNFTITGSNFKVYSAGKEITKSTQSIAIPNVTGLYYIYYTSAGVLATSTSAWNLTSGVIPVATIYWNSATQTGELGEERHGLTMDGQTHAYLHTTVGTRYQRGFALSIDSNRATTTDGIIWDEDLELTIPQQTQFQVFFRQSTNFRFSGAQNAYYLTSAGGVILYDNGGTTTTVPNNSYVNYWFFATNDVSSNGTPVVTLMGQSVGNLAAAQAENYQNLSLANLPFAEMKILYRVTMRNVGGVPTWIQTTDLRGISNLPSGTYVANAHSGLTGLDYASAGHIGFAGIDVENIFSATNTFNGVTLMTNVATLATTSATRLSATESLVVGTSTFDGFAYGTGNMSVQNTLYANVVSSSAYYLNGSPLAALPSGTAGQTLYYSGSAWTATSTLTVATSTGYVGIGTSSPIAKLTVYNNATSGYLFYVATSSSRYFNVSADGRMEFFGNYVSDPNSDTNTFLGVNTGRRQTNTTGNTALGAYALNLNSNGNRSVAIGTFALASSTGSNSNDNIAMGYSAMGSGSRQEVTDNIAIGSYSMYVGGSYDRRSIAIGSYSLYAGAGDDNIAIGYQTLSSTASGYNNIAMGSYALSALGGYADNIAIGNNAARYFGYGNNNVVIGSNAAASSSANQFSNAVFIGYESGFSARSNIQGIVAVGYQALKNNYAQGNVAIGSQASLSNTTGINNTAVGYSALLSNTTGQYNSTFGYGSMYYNIDGQYNVAIGNNAMYNATSGDDNVVIGYTAANNNNIGNKNVVVGSGANYYNVTSSGQTAIGYQALRYSRGDNNIGIGYQAINGNNNYYGKENIGIGTGALYSGPSGDYNAAFGYQSLYGNTSGANNVGLGYQAGYGPAAATQSTVDTNSIYIGYRASRDLASTTMALNNAIAIGYQARVSASNTMALGGTGSDAIKVGIGTSSPSAYLHVYGAASGIDLLRVATSSAAGIFVINSTGNVGIGVANANTKLEVAGMVSSSNLTVNGNATTTGALVLGSAPIAGFISAAGNLSAATVFATNISSTNATVTNMYINGLRVDSFANGSILFTTSTGVIAADPLFYWDMVNDRMGLGSTLTPSLLSVSQTSNDAAGGLSLTSNYIPGVDWTASPSIPSTKLWANLAGSADGKYLVAGVANEYLYTSSDYGATWVSSTAAGLRTWQGGLAISNDGTKIAAGNSVAGGSIYLSSDSGATWVTSTAPTSSALWRGVAGSSNGAVLAAVKGTTGDIYVSTNTGATWTTVSYGGKQFYDVAVSSDGTKMVAAAYGSYLYYSTDSGVSFAPLTASGIKNWWKVAISDDGTEILASVYTSGGYTYVSNDSGATFSTNTSAGTSADWRAIDMSPDGKYMVVTKNAGYIYTSNDYGATWTTTTAAGSRAWFGVAISSDGNKMAAAAQSNYIYYYINSISNTRSLYVDQNDILNLTGTNSSILSVIGSVSSTNLLISGSATTSNLVVGTSTFDGFNYGTGNLSVQNTLYANIVSSSAYYLNGSPMTALPGGTAGGQTLYWNGSAWTATSTLTVATSTGYVGIGTTTPDFKLTINGGILSYGTYGSGETLTAAGAGTRMIWYPRKAAFRAGYVTGSQWDDSNIGSSSIALGYNNIAYGSSSVVLGNSNTVSSSYSGILSGMTNAISLSGAYNVITGGVDNNISSTGNYNTIGGGNLNKILYNADSMAIFGGYNNTINRSGVSFIGGGSTNLINSASNYAYNSIVGGQSNQILSGVADASILGGSQNTIAGTGSYSSILGGFGNSIAYGNSVAIFGTNNAGYSLGSNNSLWITGVENHVTSTASPNGSTWVGGRNMNMETSYNVFLWGVSSTAITVAPTADSFLIYSGNVGINTTTPAYKLTINSFARNENLLQVATTSNPRIFTINSAGNVGIGLSNQTQRLEVAGTISSTGVYVNGGITATTLVSTANLNVTSYATTANLTVGVSTYGGYAYGNGDMSVANNLFARIVSSSAYYLNGTALTAIPSGAVGGQTLYWSGSNWMATSSLTISTTSGYVGIGTTTPTDNLTVRGGVNIVPKTPTRLATFSGTISGAQAGNPIFISDKYVYMAMYNGGTGGTNDFAIYDISNPSSPTTIYEVDLGATNGATAIYVSGKYAYLGSIDITGTAAGQDLVIYDVSNPYAPVAVGGINFGASKRVWNVQIVGKYAYLGVGDVSSPTSGLDFVVYNISDPTNPVYLSGVSLTTNAASYATQAVYINGRYAYIGSSDSANNNYYLYIYDISNPNAISQTGSYRIAIPTLPNFALRSIKVVGKYAFLGTASTTREFQIVNISNPASPTYVNGIDLGAAINSVEISGKYAYLFLSANGSGEEILIYDISDPNNLVKVAGYETSANVLAAAISGRTIIAGNATSMAIYETGGLDVSLANIGNILGNSLNLSGNAVINNTLSVQNGLNVGLGGIMTDGNLSVDGTTTASYFAGQLGIGTSTMPYKLSVISASSTEGLLVVGTTTNNSIFAINSAGNVGIGTASPNTRLEVAGTVSSTGLIVNGNGTTTGRLYAASLSIDTLNGFLRATDGLVSTGTLSAGDLSGFTPGQILFGSTSGSIAQTSNFYWNEASTSLSIGTSTPPNNYELIVWKDQDAGTDIRSANESTGTLAMATVGARAYSSSAQAAVGAAIRMVAFGENYYDGSNEGYLPLSGSVDANPNLVNGLGLFSRALNSNIRFYAGGNDNDDEKMRILSNGNVGIGTFDPATKLDVAGTVSANQYNLSGTTGIEIQSPVNTWAFKFKDGLPLTGTSTGLLFNVDVGEYQFKIGDINLLTIGAFTGVNITGDVSSTGNIYSGGNQLTLDNFYDYGTASIGINADPDLLTLNIGNFAVNGYMDVNSGGGYTAQLGVDGSAYAGAFYSPVASTMLGYNDGVNDFAIYATGDTYLNGNVTTTGNLNAGTLSVVGTSTVGNIVPSANLIYNLGSSDYRWDNLWAQYINVGSSTWSIGQNVDNNFNIYDDASGAGTARITIAAGTGNVGIGTTTPQAKLHVSDGGLLVDNPANSVLASSTGAIAAGLARGTFVSGKYAYIANYYGLAIMDVSNPSSPILVSSTGAIAGGEASGVYVSGKYAYLANGILGLAIIDVSNPSSPVLVSSTGAIDAGSAISVYVSGKYAYLANSGGGLAIMDISNPSSPVLVSSTGVIAAGSAVGVYVSGKYAYVANNLEGLTIVDISNPSSPVLVSSTGQIGNLGQAAGVYVSGKYAYVANTSQGLSILDISNPSSPVLVTSTGAIAASLASSVYVSGKYAYVANTSQGLAILDISNPSSPVLVQSTGAIATGDANSVYVSGKYAYLANNDRGLAIIDLRGADIFLANIGNINTDALTVSENMDIAGTLNIGSGLNVSGGIMSNGAIAGTNLNISGTTTAACFTIDGINCITGGASLPSGTAGQTLYYSGSAWTATSTITIATSTGNVGIGTTTPAEKLVVANGSILSANSVNNNSYDYFTTFKTNVNFVDNIFNTSSVGVYGYSTSTDYALANPEPHFNAGVYGKSDGAGVVGIGNNWGGLFQNLGEAGGTGLWAVSNNGIGAEIQTDNGSQALYVHNGNASNYAVYSEQGLNYFAGNVGIGTTTPTAKLSIGSGMNFETQLFGVYNGIWLNGDSSNSLNDYSLLAADAANGGDLFVNRPTGGNIYFRENNSNQMAIMSSTGNVGIGTITPDRNLQVVYDLNDSTGGLNVTNNSTGGAAVTNITLSNDTGSIGGFYGLSSNHGLTQLGYLPANTLAIWNPTSSLALLADNDIIFSHLDQALSYSELMRLTAGGNLGIGTTTPGSKLTVDGDIDITGNYLVNGVPFSGGSLPSGTVDGQTLYWSGSAWTATSTLTVATSTGYIGIGTTNPSTALEVNGIVSSTGLRVNSGSGIIGIDSTGLVYGVVARSMGYGIYSEAPANFFSGMVSVGAVNANVMMNIKGSSTKTLLNVLTSSSKSALYISDSGMVIIGTSTDHNPTHGSVSFNNQIVGSLLITDPITEPGSQANVQFISYLDGIALRTGNLHDTTSIPFYIRPANGGDINFFSSGNPLMQSSTLNIYGRLMVNGVPDGGMFNLTGTSTFSLVDVKTSSTGQALYVANSGKTGIGTASPTYQLHVSTTLNGADGIYVKNNNAGTAAQARLFVAASTTEVVVSAYPPNYTQSNWAGRGGVFANNTVNNGLNIGSINADGTVDFYTGGSNASNIRMTIDSTGNVGIGTTTPAANLHIYKASAAAADVLLGISTSTSGGGQFIFKVLGSGQVVADNGTLGSPADYAEYYYSKDADLESGEAVCVDVTKNSAVVRCTRAGDDNIMGIVSTKPLILGNAKESYINNPNYKVIAMLGQIPARASAENGEIRPGDYLTAASMAGYVMKAGSGDSTVGVALEGLSSGEGSINVMISRRNKSLTVEQVEEAVTKRIADMELEDEVNIMLADSIKNYDFTDDIASYINPFITTIDTKLALLTDTLSLKVGELASSTLGADNALSSQILAANNLISLLTEQSSTTASGLSVTSVQVDELSVKLTAADTRLSALELFASSSIADLQTAIVGLNLQPATTSVAYASSFASLSVDGDSRFNGKIKVAGDAEFAGKVVVRGQISLGGDAVGQAKIMASTTPNATTTVHIVFETAYDNLPIITVTPVDYDGKWKLSHVASSGFDIIIDPTPDQDVIFNWHAFSSLPETKLIVSDGSSELINNETADMMAENPPVEPALLETAAAEATSSVETADVPAESATSTETAPAETVIPEPEVIPAPVTVPAAEESAESEQGTPLVADPTVQETLVPATPEADTPVTVAN